MDLEGDFGVSIGSVGLNDLDPLGVGDSDRFDGASFPVPDMVLDL